MLAKPHMMTDLSRFCTSDQLSHPLSVDPMFNFSKFEVTPFSYKQMDWCGSKFSWPNGNSLQQTEECV